MSLCLPLLPRLAPLLLLLAGGGISSLAGNPPRSTGEVADLLVSDLPADVAKAEAELSGRRPELVAGLLQTLGAELPTNKEGMLARCAAGAELGVILSPWLRGVECSARAGGFMSFDLPRRPVERVSGLPEAAVVRRVLQAAITAQLKDEGERRGKRDYSWEKAIEWECEALEEVADDATIDWALALLASGQGSLSATPLARLVDSYLGRPPSFEKHWFCSFGESEDALERFYLKEGDRLLKISGELDATWKKVSAMKPAERIAFSIQAWREHFVPKQRFSADGYRPESGLIFQEFAPLIRFGTAAVEPLRAQQARESELEDKAVWEVVIAAITGKEDPAIIRALLEDDAYGPSLVAEIIIAAGSRQWLTELEKLQGSSVIRDKRPTEAIAACYREEGIPALKRILAEDPDNYSADYAIKEMEARAAKGFPKGMSRRE